MQAPAPATAPLRLPLRRRLPGRGLAGLAALALASLPLAAQDVPDQVFVLRKGRGDVVAQTGLVTVDSLEEVELERDGKTLKLDSADVQRIVFGTVPPSYRDGRTLQARGDWENAVARFRVAAGDASARAVVQAAARLEAAECLVHWGESEPVHFGEAAEELAGFLSSFPDNRRVPRAQTLRARALRLAGRDAEAAQLYREVFEHLNGTETSPGYDVATCLRAGLEAARALLSANDSLGAREVFKSLESALDALIASAAPEDTEHVRAFEALRAEARLGEGFAELAGGNTHQARTFFEGARSRADASTPAAGRFAAMLGLAEALLAEGETRQAELLFARVAALDPTDRDRVARALVRQAECATALADAGAAEQVHLLLSTVVDHYGDTPWARVARERLPQTPDRE